MSSLAAKMAVGRRRCRRSCSAQVSPEPIELSPDATRSSENSIPLCFQITEIAVADGLVFWVALDECDTFVAQGSEIPCHLGADLAVIGRHPVLAAVVGAGREAHHGRSGRGNGVHDSRHVRQRRGEDDSVGPDLLDQCRELIANVLVAKPARVNK